MCKRRLEELEAKYKVAALDKPARQTLEKEYPNVKFKLDSEIAKQKSTSKGQTINYGMINASIKISGLFSLKIEDKHDEATLLKKKNLFEMGIYLVELVGFEAPEGKKIIWKKK